MRILRTGPPYRRRMHFFPNSAIGTPYLTRIAARLAALAALLVTGCAPEAGSALDMARERGLRAGFAIEPPYAFVDSTGAATGEAPEILRRSAAALGIRDVAWVPLEFPDLIPALGDHRIDAIAAGLFITPERLERVRFSTPTACVGPALVTRGGECDSCRIAVLQGSVEHRAVRRSGPSVGEAVPVPDIATGVAALRDGSAAAFAISAPTARALAREAKDLEVRPAPFPDDIARAASGCAAFGFRPEDAELAAAFDSVLRAFVGSPEHLRIARRYGFEDAEIPCAADRPARARKARHCFPVPEQHAAP